MKVHEAEMILEYCADIPCRLNIIRRQCAALDDEIDTMRGVNMDGMPRGGEPGDGPATMAVKMDELGIGDRFRVLHQQQEELRADFELIQKEIDSMSGVHNIILTEFYSGDLVELAGKGAVSGGRFKDRGGQLAEAVVNVLHTEHHVKREIVRRGVEVPRIVWGCHFVISFSFGFCPAGCRGLWGGAAFSRCGPARVSGVHLSPVHWRRCWQNRAAEPQQRGFSRHSFS